MIYALYLLYNRFRISVYPKNRYPMKLIEKQLVKHPYLKYWIPPSLLLCYQCGHYSLI